MTSDAVSVEEYLSELSPERAVAIAAIRDVINANIPDGFEEQMGYGHFGWAVPHSIYPAGYHCDPKQALPFIGVASQKNFIALYHMGIYADPVLLAWFQDAWSEATTRKLDMGKSCIRFKKPAEIPIDLIGRLASKITVDEWIQTYEREMKR